MKKFTNHPFKNQPPLSKSDKFLTPKQLTERYALPRQTIYYWTEEGWLRHYRVSKNIFILEEDFLTFMANHVVDKTPHNYPSKKGRNKDFRENHTVDKRKINSES